MNLGLASRAGTYRAVPMSTDTDRGNEANLAQPSSQLSFTPHAHYRKQERGCTDVYAL